MKKIVIGCIGCIACTYAGLWSAIFAYGSTEPKEELALIFLTALLFSIAILFAGYGNTGLWKRKDKE